MTTSTKPLDKVALQPAIFAAQDVANYESGFIYNWSDVISCAIRAYEAANKYECFECGSNIVSLCLACNPLAAAEKPVPDTPNLHTSILGIASNRLRISVPGLSEALRVATARHIADRVMNLLNPTPPEADHG